MSSPIPLSVSWEVSPLNVTSLLHHLPAPAVPPLSATNLHLPPPCVLHQLVLPPLVPLPCSAPLVLTTCFTALCCLPVPPPVASVDTTLRSCSCTHAHTRGHALTRAYTRTHTHARAHTRNDWRRSRTCKCTEHTHNQRKSTASVEEKQERARMHIRHANISEDGLRQQGTSRSFLLRQLGTVSRLNKHQWTV